MGSLNHSRLDFVAKCAASGMSLDQISQCSGVGLATVRALVKGGHSEVFDSLYEGWNQKALQVIADHRFKLQEHLESAYRVWGTSITQTQDPKLAYTAARDLITELAGSRAHADVNVNVGFQQNNIHSEQTNTVILEAAQGLGVFLRELREHRSGAGPDPHERVGDEALPGSYRIVAEAERKGAQPIPGKGKGNGSAAAEPLEGTPVDEGPTEP